MENKQGRKSMQDWQEMTDALTARVYKSGFNAGYDAAKDETPDVATVVTNLVNHYTNHELSAIVDDLQTALHYRWEKTQNEQRAELIQRAREFVEGQRVVRKGKKVYISPGYVGFWCSADFVVNADKRTVVCLLKSASDNVRSKGIAKCMPGEVFNAEIGKAIALARALEIDVPKEFMQAVQPDEWAVGQIVTFPAGDSNHMKLNYQIDSVSETVNNLIKLFERGKASADLTDSMIHELPIIDDTNAQYEVTT
ncbi:hypothetical protein CSV75_01610 [Sporosarcina sp. P18a]|uniref:hypothetical protein n=1 Tax=Sporosarcina sp. P18a TaxID=2048259 RepID=UPI000C170490|nr:hypothetical protein [Sporosarcina sp. P18a]PIC80516.1 hypothetical protein CSV75_01610 [Sporosarcina sp. P18a]